MRPRHVTKWHVKARQFKVDVHTKYERKRRETSKRDKMSQAKKSEDGGGRQESRPSVASLCHGARHCVPLYACARVKTYASNIAS